MADVLTAEDPRYREMFDVTREAMDSVGRVDGDLTDGMCALRDEAPVQKGSLHDLLGLGGHAHDNFSVDREPYTLFDFAACDRAFRENLLFSSEIMNESSGSRLFGHTILNMVGDEHRRYRSVVQPLFLRPRAMKWWRETLMVDMIEALIDNFADRDRVDLNIELCARMPVHVVTRGIGLDGNDALTFRYHLHRSTTGARGLPREAVMESTAEVTRMLSELLAKRRDEPGEDVMSGLANNSLPLPDGSTRRLTDEEIFGYCRLILLAGGGTTWRQMGITIVALLQDRSLWEACRADRKLIEPAIEEGARWLPTDPVFHRMTTDAVTIAGVDIPKGARIDVCLGAANRDPSRWDDADRFDPFRKAKYHLGFGLGPHQCLGQHVAKQEIIIAINRLMDRFPDIVLDTDSPPSVMGGLHQRGMTTVPVRLHGAA